MAGSAVPGTLEFTRPQNPAGLTSSSSSSSSPPRLPPSQSIPDSIEQFTMACTATLDPSSSLATVRAVSEPDRIRPSSFGPGSFPSALEFNTSSLSTPPETPSIALVANDAPKSAHVRASSAFDKQAVHSISPFLTKHVPTNYAPVGKVNKNVVSHGRPDKQDTKYCYRHRPDLKCRRAANEPSMDQLQNELDALPQDDQQAISHVWSLFSAAPAKHRTLMLQGLLAQCCFPQLSFISASVRELIKIDFLSALPTELGLRVLCFLDPTSLCKAAQVSRRWRSLADDDVVWHRMCEQHIDRKCKKCGWGLPLLDKYRLRVERKQMQIRAASLTSPLPESTLAVAGTPTPQVVVTEDQSFKSLAGASNKGNISTSESTPLSGTKRTAGDALIAQDSKKLCTSPPTDAEPDYFQQRRKSWKDVYRHRFIIGTNWKYGRYSLRTFKGHTNGVICLQYNEETLASGSYDCTIKLWNMETGEITKTLVGHTLGVRCLQFDDSKLVSGSLDGTVRVWSMRTGESIRTLDGGEGGVIGLHLVGSILACGSADRKIRVWNFKTRKDFTLRGHTDWVNSVKIDLASRTLFSASDDCTARLWDLDTKECIQTFEGHVAQVQQVLILPADFEVEVIDPNEIDLGNKSCEETLWTGFEVDESRKPPPRYILTGGLDSTIRLWDVWKGSCVRTFFGHLEGIWGLAADTLRIVSAGNDCMVKIWDPRTGKCESTIAGHQGPVTCVGLSDRRMCTGSEDHDLRLYTFDT